jgi:hypothetical protein
MVGLSGKFRDFFRFDLGRAITQGAGCRSSQPNRTGDGYGRYPDIK